ncbi:MAG: hypothetical protein DRQ88_06705 [Epsilonproteobacteria bacterium]|nr:MAG: hypothetical protein DRQ89_02815 [Campylobacterota bacterium]RLA66404.1 MAG: hypothetical protein DRQ88_06705 [Campylobacterota bacterium]
MKLNFSLPFFLILTLFISCSSGVVHRGPQGESEPEEETKDISGIRKKIVILRFLNESPYEGDILELDATSELKNQLRKTNRFIIDSASANLFGDSKEIYSGGGLKLTQKSRSARIAGINFVIFGRIIDARIREKKDSVGVLGHTTFYSEALVELRMYDITSKRQIFLETYRGVTDASTLRNFTSHEEEYLGYRNLQLRRAIQSAVKKGIPKMIRIADRLDWRGRIARVLGQNIYLNAGQKTGILIGDVLKVVTSGREVYDPETGALIGLSKGIVKGTIEVTEYVGDDGAVAILHSGGQVLAGDYVELY